MKSKKNKSKNFFGSTITKEIWSSIEIISLVYVGSAGDFSLNSENDWLFYTGKLPKSPQIRMVETLAFNQKMIFISEEDLKKLGDKIRKIHTRIEEKRGKEEGDHPQISNKAFVEVGDMLIEYGIRGYEYIKQKELGYNEKQSYFNDLRKLFTWMHIDWPDNNFLDFQSRRKESVAYDLEINEYTTSLYSAYRKDLGAIRFWILKKFQAEFLPKEIAKKLKLRKNFLFSIAYKIYPIIRNRYLFNIIMLFLLKSETRKMLKNIQKEIDAKLPEFNV